MFWTNMPVSYLLDGTIDWAALEDEIPDAEDDMEFAREIQKLDFSQPQPSNLHPYFHQQGDPDCFMIGHWCNCPECRGLENIVASPARKRSNSRAETAALVQANPIPLPKTHEAVAAPLPPRVSCEIPSMPPAPARGCREPSVGGSIRTGSAAAADSSNSTRLDLPVPGSARGVIILANVRSQIETLADSAAIPAPPAVEKAYSTRPKTHTQRNEGETHS